MTTTARCLVLALALCPLLAWTQPVLPPASSAALPHATDASAPVAGRVGAESAKRADAGSRFEVRVNSPWLLSGDDTANTVTVVTGDTNVVGLRIANSTLAEKTNSTPLATQALKVCREANGNCDPPGELAPFGVYTLYLRHTTNVRPTGNFAGALAFAANARQDVLTVTMEVFATAVRYQVAGAITIFLGVGLAWFLNVWSRNRLDRLAALRPAIATRQKIAQLLAQLQIAAKHAGNSYPDLENFYGGEADRLLTERLDSEGLLPTSVPSVTAMAMAGLKALLQSLEQPILGLTIVIRDGVEPLTRALSTSQDGGRNDILRALAILDDHLAASTEAAARELVARARREAFPVPAGVQMQPAAPGKVESARTELHQVVLQTDRLTQVMWLAYLLLTVVIGAAILILRNPGFGTPMDFVYCLLWGFGLPTSLDKLQQSTPASVSTAIGIQLPK